ncbi:MULTISPECIES: MMPL family transporter [unclassified Streptomyces]|uniref:MMPL family transporter n=1 Tax=unclassified Streptomyces TaxID=2593676 RepID=UPI001F0502D1|nr:MULTISPECIES: MMPL family transporter [unclassified Streptomyces]MCH0565578.1 MMPL family transporter [Streptomyces sp. MUM 2J]MCH0572101.1 MMPL family transporter [Streptomyces sp. MUM 136J]
MGLTDRTSATRTKDSGPPGRGLLHAVGVGCARHPWRVICVWLLVLLSAVAADRAWGGDYADDFNLSGTPSQTGADLLDAHAAEGARGVAARIVVRSDDGALTAHRDELTATRERLAGLPDVVSAAGPFDSPGAVAGDRRTGYFTVRFDRSPATFEKSYLDRVDEAVSDLRAADVTVEYGGSLGQLARPAAAEHASEAIGIGTAVLVLLLGFGSVAAAGFPLLTAVVGLLAGLSALGLLAAQLSFAVASPTLATMMGLGVGLDYSLFLVTRHRKLLHTAPTPAEAAGRTVSTSGRAVLVAALTVTAALAGLFASGVDFIGMLGLAAGTTVIVGALAALTLTPALLGLAGRRIDRWHVRTPVDEPDDDGDVWHRWAATVRRRPWTFLILGLLVLGVLGAPAASLRLGHVDGGASPTSYTERRAYDLTTDAFGPGANGPLTLVVTLDKDRPTSAHQRADLARHLYDALTGTPGVASATPPTATPDGALLVSTITPDTGPQDEATTGLVHRLQDDVLPDTLSPSGATGYLTGTTAAQQDFRDILSDRLPQVVGIVVVAAFVLLLVVFRSPVIALKAAVLNLLSITASFGVVVAVFQWGWGASLLGIGEAVPVESYVPMMMFAIVFGLSMDYEIFLLSRVRETWLETRDNHRSVAVGLAGTARVISCAALIMTSVFLAFLLSTNVVIKMLALGLGVSVVLDATVVRLLLVPAAMNLLGQANWWMPRRLDRLLPRLEPEGRTTVPTPERQAAPSPAEPR